MKEIVQVLRQKYGNECVAVTALTGIGECKIVNQLWIDCFIAIDKCVDWGSAAACNIGGCTIHAFAGIGLGNESKQELLKYVCKKSNNIKRWKKTSVFDVSQNKNLAVFNFESDLTICLWNVKRC